MWGQMGFDSTPASGSWGEYQSTTATAPEVGLGGTEGFISKPKNGPKSESVSLISLHQRRCGDSRDWIVPSHLEPGENSNLRKLQPRKSVSAEQMVLFDI